MRPPRGAASRGPHHDPEAGPECRHGAEHVPAFGLIFSVLAEIEQHDVCFRRERPWFALDERALAHVHEPPLTQRDFEAGLAERGEVGDRKRGVATSTRSRHGVRVRSPSLVPRWWLVRWNMVVFFPAPRLHSAMKGRAPPRADGHRYFGRTIRVAGPDAGRGGWGVESVRWLAAVRTRRPIPPTGSRHLSPR